MAGDLSKNKELIPNLVLQTFPRSGSHYLVDTLLEYTGLRLKKTHTRSKLPGESIISIIRDPFDSIHSIMKQTQDKGKPEQSIEQLQNQYIFFYHWMCQKSDYIIDFNDLVNQPDAVVRKLCNDFDIICYGPKFYTGPNERNEDYSESSKTLDNYYDFDFTKEQISKAYSVFNKALLQKVQF